MRFCADMVEVAHVWDDLVDCDKPVSAATADATFRKMMLEMPANGFYRENFTFLHPVMILVWAQWDAANRMEAAPLKNDFVKPTCSAPRSTNCSMPALFFAAGWIGRRKWGLRFTGYTARTRECHMPDPVTAVMAGASILGAWGQYLRRQSAADAQTKAAAAASAAALQQQQNGLTAQKGYFDTSTAPLSNIAQQGVGAYSNLEAAIPGLTAPITMDQKTLEATPGYQFNLSQGLRGVDSVVHQPGLSGAQAKAAATYATGLADSTYQNQFNNANTNKQNAFNFLLNTATPGINAAGTLAAAGTSAGNAALGNSATVGNTLSSNAIGAGNARAGADIATGQNISNAITGTAGQYAARTIPSAITACTARLARAT
jgi:hypothetical protein